MRPVRLCVDVGANIGQSLLEFLSWWPQARCVSFEPLPEAWEELSRAVSSSDERAVAYPLAISDFSGEKTLYAWHVQPTSSSLREINRSADSVSSHRGLRETPSVLEQEGGGTMRLSSTSRRWMISSPTPKVPMRNGLLMG